MKNIRPFLLFLLLFSLLSCTPPPPPAVVPAAQEAGSRVVLVSFDGVGWDELEEARGELGDSGWNRIRREGATARMIPVDPTLTAVTHASMITGTVPSETGVVSNVIHIPGTEIGATVSGFDAAIEAEPIWVAARRAGRRVGAITYPGLDGATPERTADWGLVYTQPVARSRFQDLTSSDFTVESGLTRQGSFSPVRVATLRWEWKAGAQSISSPVQLLALDSTNDGVENYDDFVVRHEGREYEVGEDRWFPVSAELPENGSTSLFGSWSKVLRHQPDLSGVTIYWGRVSRTVGYPDSYRQLIDREVGFWPGPPDDWAMSQWMTEGRGIDPATYAQQVSRFSDFFTRATLVSKARMEWDILLSYQPIVDEVGHSFMLVDPRQAQATPQNMEIAAAMRLHGHRVFDSAVARLIDGLAPSENLVVVSDHGMAPLHTMVRLNKLLVDWGFARAGDRGLAPESRWAAYSSGGYGNLHPIAQGAEGEAEVLAGRLRDVRTPTGEPLFERVVVNSASENPLMGAIQVWLAPGYAFTSSLSGELLSPSNYYGQHGYLSHHPAMHAIAAGIGPAVGPLPETISQTSIAGWLARLLGVPQPADAR